MSEAIAPVLSFTIKRTIDAPVDAVWNAWADPEMVKQWWGPDGFTAPVCRMDFREGGTTLVSMKAPEFGEIFNNWTYSRIEPKRRIEFVSRFADADGNQVEPSSIGMPPEVPSEVPHVVTFEDLGDRRTEMSITETGYSSPQSLEMSKAGQEQVVTKLAESVEKPRR